MSTSDIFQIPNELKRDHLSFCENSVKSIQEWGNNLTILQLGDSSKSLFNALIEVSELKCQETLRFDLIQALHPILENVLNSLEKHFFNQSLITSDRNEHIIELAFLIRTQFAKIYIDITKRSHTILSQQKFSLFALKLKKNLQTARIVASYYALQQLSLLLYQQQILYSTQLPGQWLIAHQLMSSAMQHNYHLNNVNLIQGTQHQLQNINQAYAQLILLDIFNTHQIRPSEIQGLYLCTFDWAKLIYISSRETTVSRYIIDSTKDHPPLYNIHQDKNYKPDIFIATQHLLDHLNMNDGKHKEKFSANEKVFLTPALHFHIHNLLTNNIERRHERYKHSAKIKICFGLSVAHYYLSKGNHFKDSLNLNAHYKLQDAAQLMHHFNGGQKIEQSHKTLDREAKKIYQVDVVDISVNGYRIKWSGETPKNLKTGEFILVQENAQSPWRGGVIRWIKQSSEKSLELGLEILAQDIVPCAFYLQTDRNNGNYHPALLMQTKQLDEVSISLILPGIQMLKDKQTILLRLGTEELRVYLVKPLLITQSVMCFNFELLNDQQKVILDNFLHKQLNDVKNHDLWETLK